MNLSMKQKQTHRLREQTCGCQGRGWLGEGSNGSLGLADANYYIYIQDKQQGPTYSTGNYPQYPVTMHNGKEQNKNVYLCMTESLCCTAEMGITL